MDSSSLPDEILIEILSLLPIQFAVSTSVLSNRWRFLWTQLTSLSVNCQSFPLKTAEFYTVIDQLLTRMTTLRTFVLNVPYFRPQRFEPWLHHLCSHNIKIIDISSCSTCASADKTPSTLPFKLPPYVFQTQSLVCLHLVPYGLDLMLPDDTDISIRLPNLKRLGLYFRASQCGFVTKLIRCCPLLGYLYLSSPPKRAAQYDSHHDALLDISCQNLTHLGINLTTEAETPIEIQICAPKLDYLLLGSIRFVRCSFVKKPIALRIVNFVIYPNITQALVEPLLSVTLNVIKLYILAEAFGIFENFFVKDGQVNSLNFHELTELTLQLTSGVDIMVSFPFESTSPRLLLRISKIDVLFFHVKNAKVLIKLAHYLLSNAPKLKTLYFSVLSDSSHQANEDLKSKLEEMSFCIDLYSCSKNFPECEINFHGLHTELPTSNGELQQLQSDINELQAQEIRELLKNDLSYLLCW